MRLHQLLHGYQNGHRLINASCEIPNSVIGKLLRLSDLSGDRIAKGFDTYITGYPINELDSYAMAKTWYAEEMSRPGCVWTHTILINYKDLYQINNLDVIFKQFSKPQINSDLSNYSKPIEFIKKEVSELKRKVATNYNFPQWLVEVTFNSLYYTDKELFIPQDNSTNLENFLLNIWLQLWPAARVNFRFCTGSFENRSTNEDKFDIQIIPFICTNSIVRSNPNAFLIERESIMSQKNDGYFRTFNEDLLSFLCEDYFSPDWLRKFFWNYCDDLVYPRKYMKNVVKIASMLKWKSSFEFDELIDALIDAFPLDTEACYIKEQFWNNLDYNIGKKDLKLLLSSKYSYGFNSDDINMKPFMKKLLQQGDLIIKSVFDEILKLQKITPIQKKYLSELVELVSIKGINDIINQNELLLFIFLSIKIDIAESLYILSSDSNWRLQIIDILLKSELDTHKMIYNIVVFSLERTEDLIILEEIVNRKPILFLDIIVEYLSDQTQTNYDKENTDKNLLLLLSNKQEYIVFWFRETKLKLKSFIYLFPYFSPNFEWMKQDDFLSSDFFFQIFKLNEEDIFNKAKPEFMSIYCFYIALGFSYTLEFPKSIIFITYTFQQIFSFLLKNKLKYIDWKFIEPHVPSLGFDNWDKCERLIRGVVDLFIKNDIDSTLIKNIFNDKQIVRMMKYCQSFGEGRRFLSSFEKSEKLIN